MIKHVTLHTCGYGVPENSEEGIGDCGEPAVTVIFWEEPGYRASYDPLYLCEKHNRELLLSWENEENEEEEIEYIKAKQCKLIVP